MTIEVINKKDIIPVKTRDERADFWLKYGAMLAWRHKFGTQAPEAELINEIREMSLNKAEWLILPMTNREILENIIRNISKEEILMIYKSHWAKHEEE